MCRPTPCSHCGKTTWTGCGNHVDDVMRRVPADRRCTCERKPAGGGFLRSLFRR
ncbi:hypothetical protein [Rhodococcus spelaei]|uniref:hypothetical protein n=1 Tax=Rhodococcus spelaei TaxID=2546320 RepID=UPI0015EF749F|nr:hypothetical protein [Rhodococcus spelaei]